MINTLAQLEIRSKIPNYPFKALLHKKEELPSFFNTKPGYRTPQILKQDHKTLMHWFESSCLHATDFTPAPIGVTVWALNMSMSWTLVHNTWMLWTNDCMCSYAWPYEHCRVSYSQFPHSIAYIKYLIVLTTTVVCMTRLEFGSRWQSRTKDPTKTPLH